MKRTLYIVMIVVLAAGMLTLGNGKADAMTPETALLVAGGIILGGAMLHAAAPEPVYAEAYPPAYYGYSYRPASRVVYVEPGYGYHRHSRYCDHGRDRGWRHEHRRYRNDGWR